MVVARILKSVGKRSNWPKDEWARVYVDDTPASKEAVSLLRESGYPVITFSAPRSKGPRLIIGRNSYYSLKDIKRLVNAEE